MKTQPPPFLAPAPGKPAADPHRRGALAALSLALLLSALGTSSANVSLPTLTEAFGARFAAVQWVVLAYLLAITTLVVSAGRLGDVLGRRRLLLGGFLIFTGGSALAGLAPSLPVLIAARGVQGAGAAVMMALALAFVGSTVSPERTGRTMGLLGTVSAVGTALGPSLGGLLIAGWGWRSLFLVNVPLGLLGWWLGRRTLPPDEPDAAAKRAGLDPLGTLLLATGLAAYALALTLGRGTFGPLNVALLLLAVSAAAGFVRAQSRTPSPLVRLERLRDPVLGPGLALSALVATVMMATLVVGPFYLARGLGLGPAAVGLMLSAGPVVVALMGVPAGRLTDRLGPARASTAGLVAMEIGSAALALTPLSLGLAGYLGPIAVLTAGYALFQTANNTAVMRDVPADHRGVVSGLLNLARNLGLITGASLMGAVFAYAASAPTLASAAPASVAAGLHATFTFATLLLALALALSHWKRRPIHLPLQPRRAT